MMQGGRLLVVIDETLAGDELGRVSRFVDDISAVCLIESISGLIRHVEQHLPMVGVTMITGDPVMSTQTAVAQILMRYTPCNRNVSTTPGGPLNREQVQQSLIELLKRCEVEASEHGVTPSAGLLPGDLPKIVSQYDVVVCVRPASGEGVWLTYGDQLVCQLAESCQQPLWRCPRKYEGIRRVVVAWPDNTTGQALLTSATNLARIWNVPICVLSAGGKRHQNTVDGDLQVAREQLALPECELLACERLEDISFHVKPDDLLVMGAYGRWWPWRLVSASHTETILQSLNCPALLLPSRQEFARE